MWNDPQTYVTFSFLVALGIILKKFMAPIKAYLEDKRNEILTALSEAGEGYENALLHLNDLKTKQSDLDNRVKEIVQLGHTQAEKIVTRYRADTSKIIEVKNKALEDLQDMMTKQHDRQVLCIIAEAIKRELERQIREGKHSDLVEKNMAFSLSQLAEIRI
jgi:F0F1-type ATP synthase membrane subunit b/b'